MWRSKSLNFLLTSALLAGTSLGVLASDRITFYLEDEPVYTNSSKDAPGFLMDVVKEMAQVMNLNYDVRFLPWKRAQLITATEKNSVIFPLTRTESRESKYQWICKIIDVPVMFINKKGEPEINTYESARKIRGLGTITGTPQEERLSAEGIAFISVTGNQLYGHLNEGRMSAIYTARPEAVVAWQAGHYQGELQFGETLQTLPLWIAASKNSELINPTQWINALETIKHNGLYDKIFEKYFGPVKKSLHLQAQTPRQK